MAWAWDVKVHLTAAERLVLLYIADNANRDGYCRLPRKSVAASCGISPTTASRAFEKLERASLLRCERPRNQNGYYQTVHFYLPDCSNMSGSSKSQNVTRADGPDKDQSGTMYQSATAQNVTEELKSFKTLEPKSLKPTEIPKGISASSNKNPESAPNQNPTQALVAYYVDIGGPKTRVGQLGAVVKKLVSAGTPPPRVAEGIALLVEQGKSPGVLDLLMHDIASGRARAGPANRTDEKIRQIMSWDVEQWR